MKEKEEEMTNTKVYSYQDLIKFENPEMYSAFGEMVNSQKKTEPMYSFGSATRDAEPKKYISKEMALVDCYGQLTLQGKATVQGPNYNPTDKFMFPENPKWSFGHQQRVTLDQMSKYQHYLRKDEQTDINTADKYTRINFPNIRIGLEPRFQNRSRKYKDNPGPQYNPSLKLEIPNAPKYSLYCRRAVKGFDPLILLNSTPGIVGPGSYFPEKSGKINKDMNVPQWSLGKGPKLAMPKKTFDLHQTYDPTISIGPQLKSQKISMPQLSIGKDDRSHRLGIFKQHMQNRPMNIRIQHPKY